MIIENFTTGTTEIIRGADAGKLLGIYLDIVKPDIGSFIIICINSDPELFCRQTYYIGQKVPGIMNRFFFEILAKAEITEHFEEGVMAGSVTDIFEVVMLAAGTHAAL